LIHFYKRYRDGRSQRRDRESFIKIESFD